MASDAEAIVRAKLAAGRQINDEDVADLLAETATLRALLRTAQMDFKPQRDAEQARDAQVQAALPDTSAVTRFEVITQGGRVVVMYGLSDVVLSSQDGGRTLKLFCKRDRGQG